MDDRPPLLKQDTSRFRLNLKCYFPCRYVLAILSFSGFCVSNAMRASLSVALVAMVNSSYSNVKAVTANNPECRRNTSEEPSKEVGDIYYLVMNFLTQKLCYYRTNWPNWLGLPGSRRAELMKQTSIKNSR